MLTHLTFSTAQGVLISHFTGGPLRPRAGGGVSRLRAHSARRWGDAEKALLRHPARASDAAPLGCLEASLDLISLSGFGEVFFFYVHGSQISKCVNGPHQFQ